MKFKTNIPALLLAVLVFVAGNGVAVFEHICNTSKTRSYALFVKPVCGMEKPVSDCCTKKSVITKEKDCCEHKQLFSKLNIQGFTAKQLKIKPNENFGKNDFFINDNPYSFHVNTGGILSGIPPPDNLYIIKYLLRPTPAELQVFRC